MIQKALQYLKVPKMTGDTQDGQAAVNQVPVDQMPGHQVLFFRRTSLLNFCLK